MSSPFEVEGKTEGERKQLDHTFTLPSERYDIIAMHEMDRSTPTIP
jgi:hypothetical protein